MSSSNVSQVEQPEKRSFWNNFLRWLLVIAIFSGVFGTFVYLQFNVFTKSRSPQDMALDRQGNFYVLDSGLPGVRKYNPSGQQTQTFGSEGTGDGQFRKYYEPDAVAVDSQGFVYILSNETNTIQKFNPNGTFNQKWEIAPKAKRLVADQQTNLYVAYSETPFIQKFSSTGKSLDWSLKQPEAFKGAFALTLDGQDNLYVATTGKILKLGQNGELLSTVVNSQNFGSLDTFTLDLQGNIFVSQWHEVQKYSPDGKLLLTWGKEAKGDQNFEFPVRGLAARDAANIYTLNAGPESNQISIKHFNGQGQFVEKWVDGFPYWFSSLTNFLLYAIGLPLGVFVRRIVVTPKPLPTSQPLPLEVEQYRHAPHLIRDHLDLPNLLKATDTLSSTSSENLTWKTGFAFLISPIFVGLALFYIIMSIVMKSDTPWWVLVLLGVAIVVMLWLTVRVTIEQKQKTKNKTSQEEYFMGQVLGTLPEANRPLLARNRLAENANVHWGYFLFTALIYSIPMLIALNSSFISPSSTVPGWLLHCGGVTLIVGLLLGSMWLRNALRRKQPHQVKLTGPEFGRLVRRTALWLSPFFAAVVILDLLNMLLANLNPLNNIVGFLAGLLLIVGYIYLLLGFMQVPRAWIYEAINIGDYDQALRRIGFMRSITNAGYVLELQRIVLCWAGRFSEVEYLVQEAFSKVSNLLVQKSQLASPLNTLTFVRVYQERYSEAMFLIENAVRCAPALKSLYHNVGEVYLWANGNPYRALEFIDISVKEVDKSLTVKWLQKSLLGDVHINRAWALQNIGRPDLADEELKIAFQKTDQKHQPMLASMYVRASRIMLTRGNTQQAVEFLTQAELLDPHGFHGRRAAQHRQLISRSTPELV